MLPSAIMDDIGSRIARIRRRMAAAAARAGRPEDAASLLAISKTVPPNRIQEAIEAGIDQLGENRVQEAETKRPLVPGSARWHLVGQLQSNKARLAAALFDCVHSVDRLSLVRKLDAAAAERERPLPVYVQVEYVRTEASERSVEAEAERVCEAVLEAPALELEGLMTLPPFEPDPEAARPWFGKLRALRDGLAARLGAPLPGLSMGMTNDFEVAIEEGATLVRVGTAIFGSRDP